MDSNKLEEKLDKIQEQQTDIRVQLGQYNTLLEEHIKRTDLNEARIEELENVTFGYVMQLHEKLDDKADKNYITWIVGISTALIGVFVALSSILN